MFVIIALIIIIIHLSTTYSVNVQNKVISNDDKFNNGFVHCNRILDSTHVRTLTSVMAQFVCLCDCIKHQNVFGDKGD